MDVSPKGGRPLPVSQDTTDGAAVGGWPSEITVAAAPGGRQVHLHAHGLRPAVWLADVQLEGQHYVPFVPSSHSHSPPGSPLLIHAGGNVKWRGHSGGKTLWSLLIRLNTQLSYGLSDCTLGHLSQINKNLCSHKNLYMMFHSSLIHNSPK